MTDCCDELERLRAEAAQLKSKLAEAWDDGCDEGIHWAECEAPIAQGELPPVYARNPYRKGGDDE